MKKVTIAVFALLAFAITQSNAQMRDWTGGSNEINIGLKPFALGASDIQYKGKLGGKTWMRLSVTDLGIRDGEAGFRLGLEKQRNMALRTRLTYGMEAGTYFDYDRIDNSIPVYNVDLGFPVGVQFHLTKRILFGIEGRPSIGLYESTLSEDNFGREVNIGTGIRIFNGFRGSIGYRF